MWVFFCNYMKKRFTPEFSVFCFVIEYIKHFHRNRNCDDHCSVTVPRFFIVFSKDVLACDTCLATICWVFKPSWLNNFCIIFLMLVLSKVNRTFIQKFCCFAKKFVPNHTVIIYSQTKWNVYNSGIRSKKKMDSQLEWL